MFPNFLDVLVLTFLCSVPSKIFTKSKIDQEQVYFVQSKLC